jgi:hypothetical protein
MKRIILFSLALIITASSFAHNIKPKSRCWTAHTFVFEGTLFDGAQNVKLTLNSGFSFTAGTSINPTTVKYLTTLGTNSNENDLTKSFQVTVYQYANTNGIYPNLTAQLTCTYANNNGNNPSDPANDNYSGNAIGYKISGNSTITNNHNYAESALSANTCTISGGLPVILINFTASKVNSSVVLRWTTTSEHSNKGWNIQGSTDGINFSNIGFIASHYADGTSEISTDYIYTLTSVEKAGIGLLGGIVLLLIFAGMVKNRKGLMVAGMLVMGSLIGFTSCTKSNDVAVAKEKYTYFRIQQIDIDGKTTVSDVKIVR